MRLISPRINPGALRRFSVRGSDIFIEDIQVTIRRQGIGTHMLQILEICGRRYGCQKVIGKLVEVDVGHRDQQLAFYSKNGYSVVFFDKARTRGRIEKDLN